jgi:3-O-methylgallate 3,4-dioxygenase
VLGLATSHTPLISMGADMWSRHAQIDVNWPGYAERAANPPEWLPAELTADRFTERYEASQRAIEQLGSALQEAEPDVIIVFGDDQREIFLDDGTPTFALYCGHKLPNVPEDLSSWSVSRQAGAWAQQGEETEIYESRADLALHLGGALARSEFDITVLKELPEGRSLGHAFGFIPRRLKPRGQWSMLPFWINTYYPPNQPSARRCFKLGESVARALREWPGNERVAIVASGGLSHFFVDEELDRMVLAAIAASDGEALSRIPSESLQSGSSEILCWIAASGALQHLNVSSEVYVPSYRSIAGSGVGCGFVTWS